MIDNSTETITLKELAQLIGVELRGDGDRRIEDGATTTQAGERDLTFLTDKALLKKCEPADIGGILTTPDLADLIPDGHLLICDDPQNLFVELLQKLRPGRTRPSMGISPQAIVDASATIGEQTNIHPRVVIEADVVIGARCDIHPGVVIGAGCRIGDDVVIRANAVVEHDCVIGNRVILHAGAIIGTDGYGFTPMNGRHQRIPQLGNVVIHDDVEIGSATCVDRGAVGSTVIGEGTKIDNLVQIAHNCILGKHNLIVAHVGIAGSVTTGDYVVCAGQVGIADHCNIGSGSMIGSKAGVSRDLPGGERYLGAPAEPAKDAIKVLMASKSLPAMRKTLRELQSEVESLKAAIANTDNVPSSDAA